MQQQPSGKFDVRDIEVSSCNSAKYKDEKDDVILPLKEIVNAKAKPKVETKPAVIPTPSFPYQKSNTNITDKMVFTSSDES